MEANKRGILLTSKSREEQENPRRSTWPLGRGRVVVIVVLSVVCVLFGDGDGSLHAAGLLLDLLLVVVQSGEVGRGQVVAVVVGATDGNHVVVVVAVPVAAGGGGGGGGRYEVHLVGGGDELLLLLARRRRLLDLLLRLLQRRPRQDELDGLAGRRGSGLMNLAKRIGAAAAAAAAAVAAASSLGQDVIAGP